MYDYRNVPEEMKKLKRWVLWKKKPLENGHATKIPVNAMNGYGAKSNDSTTWTTFEEAKKKIEYYNCNGLGFMLGNGYFGVDIDHALDNQELISEFTGKLKSYTEVSQSGEGLHIICKGVLPQGARRKGNIEMYDSVRFFAMTGNVPDDCKAYGLNDGTEAIKPLYEKYLGEHKKEVPQGAYVFTRESVPSSVPNGMALLRDDELIAEATSSKNGTLFSALYYGQWDGLYKSQSDADLAFCSLLAFWANKDTRQMDRIFRQSGLYRDKWEQKRGQYTYGEMTISKAIQGCKDTYSPKNTGFVYNAITGEAKPVSKTYDYSDTGNAERFIDTYGEKLRYNFDNKCWVIWDGKTWTRDTEQQVKKLADDMIVKMKKEAFDEPDTEKANEIWKNVKRLSSSTGKEAMIKEAQHIGDTPTVNSDYDRDIYLLNCENGVVDLRTSEILPHDRKYMMSKNTHVCVDFNAIPKDWLKALDDIFLHDRDVVDFVHKAIGYTLTGDTKEQCFFQCWGNGSNGKSVFFNTLYRILGDYSLNSQVDSILTRGSASGNASPDIARMDGRRFVRTNEPNENARFNEGLVKQLTGGDIVTARFLYGSDFEFRPVFKLWIACNYKIVVRGTDKGIWRRMRLIPFEATFEGKSDDKGLEERIAKNELGAILAWAVRGCIKWQKEGLGMPETIKVATNEYRDEMDIVESFIKECVRKKKGAREKAGDVFMAYKEWAKRGNEWVMTQSKFGVEMAKKFEKKNMSGYVYYLGMQLRNEKSEYVFTREEDEDAI